MKITQQTPEGIHSGSLACGGGHFFAIDGGVPRLRIDQKLDQDPVEIKGDSLSVAASFGAEWSHFDYQKDRTWHQTVSERKRLFLKEVAISEADLSGKAVLDAGCGNGSLSVGISEYGCEVLAIDVSPSVDAAHNHFKSLPDNKTYFVQGDLMNPPLKAKVFDVVFSSGVLHHNPNTKEALYAIAKSLKSGGKIYIWVYGQVPGIAHRLKEIFRKSISPLPSRIKHAIVALWLPQAMVRQYIRTGLRLNGPEDRLKWSERFILLLDHYTPQYRWEHTPEEVMNWYRELGYIDISKTEDRAWGFGCVAKRPLEPQ